MAQFIITSGREYRLGGFGEKAEASRPLPILGFSVDIISYFVLYFLVFTKSSFSVG